MSQLLGRGEIGEDVIQLQTTLTTLGYPTETTGIFDDATEEAIRAYQRDAGVPESGVYDDETWNAMAASPLMAVPGSYDQDAAGDASQWGTDVGAAGAVGDASDLSVLEHPQPGGERDFRPEGDVAVRVDPTHYVFWGFMLETADLLADFNELLDEIANYLVVIDLNAIVDVIGHTSTSGAPDLNQALSESRAHAIRGSLLERGVAADRIRAWGEGERRPLVSEDHGTAALARNRRVEVVIHAIAVATTTTPSPSGEDDGSGPPEITWPDWRRKWTDPRVRVREIIDPGVDPPEDGRPVVDRIRHIFNQLPEWVRERLEFDFDDGVLFFNGYALSTLALLLAGAAAAGAALGLSAAAITELLTAYDDLVALEQALRDLVELSGERPPPVPPQDAGVPPPAGVPEPGTDAPDGGVPDTPPADGGPPDADPGGRRSLTAYHGANGDAILGILRGGVMHPDGGRIWLNLGDYRESYNHGGDRRRRANFVAQLEITFDPAVVTEQRRSTPGVAHTLELHTTEPVAAAITQVFRRRQRADADDDDEERYVEDVLQPHELEDALRLPE